MIPTIAVCTFIAILVIAICNIFIKCMIMIAKTIAKEEVVVNFKSDIIIIVVCTFIICMYFLI